MNIEINGSRFDLLEPNICPHCHITQLPNYRWHQLSKDYDNKVIIISTWHCTSFDCRRVFVCEHGKDENRLFKHYRFLDGLPKGPIWPQPILDLKNGQDSTLPSNFIKTYLQSLEAEHRGLDEIAGMGYRKAIEYLVKDWAIQKSPEEKEGIQKRTLTDVVKSYFKGPIKDLLERVVWLGNDQSHYIKLFDEYDIKTLKKLIAIALNEIDQEYQVNYFTTTIQGRK